LADADSEITQLKADIAELVKGHEYITKVLGLSVPKCACEGCRAEMQIALTTATDLFNKHKGEQGG
jgi:hypothetical protein